MAISLRVTARSSLAIYLAIDERERSMIEWQTGMMFFCETDVAPTRGALRLFFDLRTLVCGCTMELSGANAGTVAHPPERAWCNAIVTQGLRHAADGRSSARRARKLVRLTPNDTKCQTSS